jgi:uncharacterized protein
MADANVGGQFVWHDLMVPDPKQAEPFYTKIAGWGTTTWESPMPYTMWTVGGTPSGGVTELPSHAGVPPHWLAYVAVPDVDAAVAKTKSLGGTTKVEPTDIPTVGRYAVLADPQGAVFAVYASASDAPPHDGEPSLGEFSWHELMTTDYDTAFRFYQALFGWELISDNDMGPLGVYRIFGRKGMPLGGMFNTPDNVPAPPNWLPYIHVDSADRVADLVKANGGTILNGPMEVPGGDRIAQCMDPQGAAFALHSRTNASQEART